MRVFRIVKEKYATLDGVGGLHSSGRWHNKGTRVIYTSESSALAAWEYIVHIGTLSLLPNDLVLLEIDIPEYNIIELPIKDLVDGWNGFPFKDETMNVCSIYFNTNKAFAIKVPSVVIPNSFNYVLNPNHPKINQCKIIEMAPFAYDSRLIDL